MDNYTIKQKGNIRNRSNASSKPTSKRGRPNISAAGSEGAPRKVIKRQKQSFKLFSARLGLDMPFCALIVILLVIGLIMLFSASYPNAYYYEGDSYYYLSRQLVFAIAGFVIMIAVSYFDYHHFHKLAAPILAFSFLLLIIVLFIPNELGVRRWIDLGLFSFQASEVTKFALILFLAHWGSVNFRQMGNFKVGVLPCVIIYLLTVLLLYLEPHYSCIVIVTMLVALMMYLSGVRLRWFAIAGVAVAAVIMFLAVTDKLSYAMERMDGWGQALIYTTDEMWDTTYQTRNSLYAIGSGGLWGLGLGQSRQKYMYLPEPQNDFIFAVVCEEIGFIGALIILLIFAALVWRGITLSMRAKDKFGSLLGIGLTAQVGLQVILNILVITDWLPNTGISLPFFSYGGTSLIMLLAQMGIVLSISRTASIEKT
ncbi:MAG: FtsW/RodA/SpoVE family cell cycle protein [Acutalibacteraceae bacterium]